MSTFDGHVKEFPDIRIDYFRASSEASKSPLAYFLSHVHTDHLVGLESCKSRFIYCSPATREILLRLEKYPHRMNFAKGILETRKQTYRHLKNLLKPIPLETPTVLELAPGRSIRVTLFDANHCVGAVMFLVEGDGKAILYTGDIRSEPWWVTSLCRHPLLIPYVSSAKQAPLKRLDTIYLDTTFAHKDDPYRHFPPKAEGLAEVLLAVSKYPKGTLFYFDSWTFGYEDVWQTLSAFIGSQIHVDDYRLGLYRTLANGTEPKAHEAAKLMGFHCGNHFQAGCLTGQPAQLHSCEKGTDCDIWKKDFVRITPIISRHKGVEMAELGIGGGQGDLDQRHELEVGDPSIVGQLVAMCATKLQGQPQLLASVMEMLTSLINERVQSISLDGSGLNDDSVQGLGEDDMVDIDDLPLERLVPALSKLVLKSKLKLAQKKDPFAGMRSSLPLARPDGLPKQITFPYSRHSSYSELCDLIAAFKPTDIHPCTVDYQKWTAANSLDFLFGHLYPGSTPAFSHDQKMLKLRGPSMPSFVNTSRPSTAGSGSASKAVSPEDLRARQGTHEDSRTIHDHYSPPRRKRKSYSDHDALDNVTRDSLRRDHVDFNAVESEPKQTGKHGRKDNQTASTMPDEWRSDSAYSRDPKRHRTRIQSPDHGRLSPPPAEPHTHRLVLRSTSPDIAGLIERSRRRSAARDNGRPSAGAARAALRQEAYDAALGSDGLQWSDIGLVSTSNGHQVKEEEL